MANWLSNKNEIRFRINIPKYSKLNYYTEYELIINFFTNVKWKLYRRYSDFFRLYEKLVKSDGKYKVYFPPKKAFNSNSDRFLEQRRKSLEMFLNEIIVISANVLPRELALFLEMDKYEIHGITTSLAKSFFLHGMMLLERQSIFEVSVLTLHSINQRLQSAAPTNLYQRQDEDFGNVLEVIGSLQRVQVVPTISLVQASGGMLGSSNIKIRSLSFDISVFSAARVLKLQSVNIENLTGFYKMSSSVEDLEVRHCLKSLDDILLGDLGFSDSSVENLLDFDGPWRCVKKADFSYNSITQIDKSVVTLRQVASLDFSHNQLSSLGCHLQHLTFLTELDLSHNSLYLELYSSCSSLIVRGLFSRLGSVRRLNLSHNRLTNLHLVDRLFSLEHLDFSHNCITSYSSLFPLCRLVCLETVELDHNPICHEQNFSIVAYDVFLDRCDAVSVNGLRLSESPPFMRMGLEQRRRLNQLTLLQGTVSTPAVVDKDDPSSLLLVSLPTSSLSPGPGSPLHNCLCYWLFCATGKPVPPGRMLYCTQVFPAALLTRGPGLSLLVAATMGSNGACCVLHCSLTPSTDADMVAVRPEALLDMSGSLRCAVVGPDRRLLRLEFEQQAPLLFLSQQPDSLDSFLGHLYHVDDGITPFGDPRLLYLNKEDRIDSLRRFLQLWRQDFLTSASSGQQKKLPVYYSELVEDSQTPEQQLHLVSRAQFRMRSGQRLLLTTVLTEKVMYLVDERLFDCSGTGSGGGSSSSAESRRLSASNSSLASNTGGTVNLSRSHSLLGCMSPASASNSSMYQFTKIDAYPLSALSCVLPEQPTVAETPPMTRHCPVFHCPVQLAVVGDKDQIYIYFESQELACQFRSLVMDSASPSPRTTYLDQSLDLSTRTLTAVSLTPTPPPETPRHLRCLNSSYQENQVAISLDARQLSRLASMSGPEVEAHCRSLMPLDWDAVALIFWSRLVWLQYHRQHAENTPSREEPQSMMGLVCVCEDGSILLVLEPPSLDGHHRLSLIVDEDESDSEDSSPDTGLCSEPEADQSVSEPRDRLQKLLASRSRMLRVFVGLQEQCLTLSLGNEEHGEQERVVVLARSGKTIQRLATVLRDAGVALDLAKDDGNWTELEYEAKMFSGVESPESVMHYSSLDHVRLDSALQNPFEAGCSGAPTSLFSSAIAVTPNAIFILRHNILEYPVRIFGKLAVRRQPEYPQFQVLLAVPLIDCLQVQLPGHDRRQLVLVISPRVRRRPSSVSSDQKQHPLVSCDPSNVIVRLQLTVPSQTEQKRLIDSIRHSWTKVMQSDTPLRVSVC